MNMEALRLNKINLKMAVIKGMKDGDGRFPADVSIEAVNSAAGGLDRSLSLIQPCELFKRDRLAD
jgi:hypothetical protein